MKNIVPLFYDMRKAEPSVINNNAIYNGMVSAYSGGNIGTISNNISKIWNSGNPNLDVIKLLCCENNFTIDYAKTLYKPERTGEADKLIKQFTKKKVPHFFIYAKDKATNQVEQQNDSVINRLKNIIPQYKFRFRAKNLEKFDYRQLMFDKKLEIGTHEQEIVDRYLELIKDIKLYVRNEDDSNNYHYIYKTLRRKMREVEQDERYITDVLVKYLFDIKNAASKIVFWNCYGYIVYDNLVSNLGTTTTLCIKCGKRFTKKTNRQVYCDECKKS